MDLLHLHVGELNFSKLEFLVSCYTPRPRARFKRTWWSVVERRTQCIFGKESHPCLHEVWISDVLQSQPCFSPTAPHWNKSPHMLSTPSAQDRHFGAGEPPWTEGSNYSHLTKVSVHTIHFNASWAFLILYTNKIEHYCWFKRRNTL